MDFMPGMMPAVDQHHDPRNAAQDKAPPFWMDPEKVSSVDGLPASFHMGIKRNTG